MKNSLLHRLECLEQTNRHIYNAYTLRINLTQMVCNDITSNTRSGEILIIHLIKILDEILLHLIQIRCNNNSPYIKVWKINSSIFYVLQ